MRCQRSHTRGFTLIELVIVIAIIALICVMAFSSYASYRKSIALSLALDSLQSAVKNVQQQARSGVAVQPLCFGLSFRSGASVRYVTAKYDAKSSNACVGLVSESSRPVDLMENIVVGGDGVNTIIFALPPHGELIAVPSLLSNNPFSFAIQFGADTSKQIRVNMSLPFGSMEKLQ